MDVEQNESPPEAKRPKLQSETSDLETLKISEADVGVTAFVSPNHTGFSGKLKTR